MPSDHTNIAETAGAILRLMEGRFIAHIIRTAAELGLADHLNDRPADVQSLSEATNTHAPSLARLLRALAAIGFVQEGPDRSYSLTQLGTALRTDASGSMRSSVLFLSHEMNERTWQALPDSIRTGKVAFEQVFGTDQFTYLSTHSDSADLFDRAMREMTRGVNDSIISSYPFGECEWIVDVGGGTGSLLIPILEQNPAMRGTILELPHVARQAKQRIDAVGLGHRCDVVEGDALAGIPLGADAYVFKSVIHMHGDENAVRILSNCRTAVSAHGKIILIERLLPEQSRPGDERGLANLLLDLSMLVLNGGSERTAAEYAALLARAGLRLSRTIGTHGPQSILEAHPT